MIIYTVHIYKVYLFGGSLVHLSTISIFNLLPGFILPGQVLGSVVAFAGVGLFGLPAGIISSGFAEIFSSRGAVPGLMVGEFLGKRPEYLDWGDLI